MTSTNIQRFEGAKDPDIRQRLAFADNDTKQYLDALIESILAHRGVEHPFLNYYAQNRLTKEQERQLYLECFYFFQHLPFYIAGMAMSTRDEVILREILLNVQDEVGDGKKKTVTHSTIYKRFLNQLGISSEEIANYSCLPTTTALNQGIKQLYTESPIVKAMGALYADETMSATMVSKLNDGLKNQGYDSQVRHFWTLHMNAEVGHSNSVFNAMFPYLNEENNRELFEAGIAEFMDLVETYWDGVDSLLRRDQAFIRKGI